MALGGDLWGDIASSLRRALSGYALGCLLGILVGLLTGRLRSAEVTIGAVVQVVRPVPAIAIVPFAALWFGLGESSKFFVVTFGVFFPVWLNTHLGMRAIHPHYIWVAQSVGATRLQTFFSVLLPAAAGYIIAGMRAAMATAFICLVAAEMAGASAGLGYRVEASQLMFQTDRMVAALLILGLLGALCDASFALIIKYVAPWYGTKSK
jgi:ABC-type nitrate/sulfonate/bicarbonate transport system permease component